MDLNGFLQVHVLKLHEPARQACADRDQRQVESAAERRGLARGEMCAGIEKVAAVARVATEEPMKIRAECGPRAPQGLVAIAHGTGRPMLRRRQMKLDAFVHMAFPPI